MRTFTLSFPDDGQGEPKRIMFQGNDPARVFSILESEKPRRRITLSEGDLRIGTLMRDHNGCWILT